MNALDNKIDEAEMKKLNYNYYADKKFLFTLLIGCLLINIFNSTLASAWSNTTFNNSIAIENITFEAGGNITRYLSVPANTYLTIADINITGLEGNFFTKNYIVANTCRKGTDWVDNDGSCTSSNVNDGNWATASPSLDGDGWHKNYSILNSYIFNITGALRYTQTNAVSPFLGFYAYTTPSNEINLVDLSDIANGTGLYYNFSLNFTFLQGQNTSIMIGVATAGVTGQNLYETGLNITYKNITKNPRIYVGNNLAYNSTGWFNNSVAKNDLVSEINSYISGCSIVDGYCQVPIIFYSDTPGTLYYSAMNFSSEGILENSIIYNSTAYETSRQYYAINISYDTGLYSSITSTFTYGGYNYTTNQSTNDNGALISNTIILNSTGSKNFYWTIALSNLTDTIYYNSTINAQTVNPIYFSFCNATNNIPYINFTFHNETLAEEAVKATFNTNFAYSLSDLSVNKTYSYTNATENFNYSFCFTPGNQTLYLSSSGSYSNSYSQERTINNVSRLTNTTTIKDLLLLPNSEGIYITFVIQNRFTERISGALIDIVQTSGSIPVEQKYTDGTGLASFWLDAGTAYTVTVTADGYETYAIGVTPSASPVTLTLTPTTDTTTTGITTGIVTRITPSGNNLTNNTQYTFSFNISSNNSNLEEYGFALFNRTGQLTGYVTGFDEDGGSLTTVYDTDDQSYIVLRYYYIIDGQTVNGSAAWYVTNNDGSEFSILHALQRLIGYTDNSSTGIYGVKRGTASGDFTFAIFIFLCILFTTGVMGYKYGITSLSAFTFVIFSLVLFIDVGAGLIPSPDGAVQHFPTIFAGAVLIGIFIKEMLY